MRLRSILAATVASASLAACGAPDRAGSSDTSDAGPESETFGPAKLEETYPGFCRALVHQNRNGTPDAVEEAHWNGEALTETTYDSDRDGDVDQRESYDYGDDQLLVERRIDKHDDGALDEIRRYEYDSRGRRQRETVDDDADGQTEMVITFEHDAEGRRIVGRGHADEDGDAELLLEYEWSDADTLTEIRMDGLRGEPDEQPDRIVNYLYDEYGNRIEGRFDYDANRRADIVVFYRYGCWKE